MKPPRKTHLPRQPARPLEVFSDPTGPRHPWTLLGLWVLIFAAYSNSFQSGLIFDNTGVILHDARIRAFTPENLNRIFTETYSKSSSGLYRPLTTASYLVNYAVLGNGERPAGYHWVNLILHCCNVSLVYLLGLVLFGEWGWALALAALWGVHPLLTESVTNVIGRADLLAAFGVLAGLLCYIRASSASGRRRLAWIAGLVAAQAIGIFSKESAAVLPLILLLYDVTWPSRAAWRKRAVAYAALILPFAAFFSLRFALPLGMTISSSDNPLVTANFLAAKVTAVRVIIRYVWLFLWPANLSPDYSYNAIPLFGGGSSAGENAEALLALGICVAAGWLAFRWRRTWKPVFFCLLFFFVALLPTSNLPVLIGSIMAERFVYLPSIGLVGCVVAAIAQLLRPRTAGIAFGLLCLAFTARTYARNFDWTDERSLWTSAVVAEPRSAKAHYNLGTVLSDVPGRQPEAISELETALRINPALAEAHSNLGKLLLQDAARRAEAITHLETALRIEPDLATAHNNLGKALLDVPGRLPEATEHLQAAVRADPNLAEAHSNLGAALSRLPGRLPRAIDEMETALRLNPDLAEVHANLGTLLYQAGRLPEAIAQFEAALRLNPNLVPAHNNLGIALAQTPGRLADAATEFETAVRIDPNFAEARNNLERARAQLRAEGR